MDKGSGRQRRGSSQRALNTHDKWSEHAKPLHPLCVGDHVLIQNQTGNHPKRWDKRGVVASYEGFDQYIVIIDGSRRLTKCNRKFLRHFEPFDPSGVTHRGKDQVVSRHTDNTVQRLTEGNPSRVLPVYPRV